MMYPDVHPSSQETSDEVFQANHSIQNEECFENPCNEIAVSNSNQEKEELSQDSNFHQLIEEFSTEVKFLCIHDNVDDLIESALNTKLLSINSQRLEKEQQKVKNVIEEPTERGNRIEKSLQNFRVIRKSFTFLKETSQISSIHAIAPILSTEEPEHSLCMRNEIEFDMPAKYDCSPAFTTFSNPLFNNDDLDSSDDESLPEEDVPAEEFKIYSNPLFDEDEINFDKLDPHCFNVESNFVESLLNRDTFIDYSSKFDFSCELAHVNPEIPKSNFNFEEEIRLIENLLYDNSSPRPSEELNAEIADTIVESIPSLPIPF
uniref:Uncharacterized protein n=1 Tax=Tanacetum cinerariifolium TaxID=118510 RepID=A0A699L4A1_TANCI|nr:hypothetical protein [Tanacetum cinerariifolium]